MNHKTEPLILEILQPKLTKVVIIKFNIKVMETAEEFTF